MKEDAQRLGYPFPYLFDEDQSVAKEYHAACTPDFFIFGDARRLVYRGQFDGSRPGNGQPVTGNDLRAALDALLTGAPFRRTEGIHRLQHQMEARERAGLLPFRREVAARAASAVAPRGVGPLCGGGTSEGAPPPP
jgi:hypothetical protein